MDKIKKYRRILKEITEYHAQMKSPINKVESFAVSDFGKNDFFLIDSDLKDRKHYIVFHLRIKDNKVFIEQDGIEYGIYNDLIDAGIAVDDIVLIHQTQQNRELIAA
jgi:XisI protein